mmetsp:Transcript_39782/g.65952  ORF Transcript_39782/g.65952 Transcript_39782/m.65952 type:complete len:637 (+) Transcript_39782:145-2055(+)|eukprot:CAMPEP_0119298822 /NCGR_PEP_ID=MMETSP1333-20130426/935_1 /TAXON_ID=418940 /ORGANISM="Scyphosphaera apsteinii, Strain RCC1455" /LENGTH=636 /DNA_ID=CAMNT_0007300023 /DNA_START=138 /DNA_END=2048 /DNA_ORIENTATION=+
MPLRVQAIPMPTSLWEQTEELLKSADSIANFHHDTAKSASRQDRVLAEMLRCMLPGALRAAQVCLQTKGYENTGGMDQDAKVVDHPGICDEQKKLEGRTSARDSGSLQALQPAISKEPLPKFFGKQWPACIHFWRWVTHTRTAKWLIAEAEQQILRDSVGAIESDLVPGALKRIIKYLSGDLNFSDHQIEAGSRTRQLWSMLLKYGIPISILFSCFVTTWAALTTEGLDFARMNMYHILFLACSQGFNVIVQQNHAEWMCKYGVWSGCAHIQRTNAHTFPLMFFFFAPLIVLQWATDILVYYPGALNDLLQLLNFIQWLVFSPVYVLQTTTFLCVFLWEILFFTAAADNLAACLVNYNGREVAQSNRIKHAALTDVTTRLTDEQEQDQSQCSYDQDQSHRSDEQDQSHRSNEQDQSYRSSVNGTATSQRRRLAGLLRNSGRITTSGRMRNSGILLRVATGSGLSVQQQVSIDAVRKRREKEWEDVVYRFQVFASFLHNASVSMSWSLVINTGLLLVVIVVTSFRMVNGSADGPQLALYALYAFAWILIFLIIGSLGLVTSKCMRLLHVLNTQDQDGGRATSLRLLWTAPPCGWRVLNVLITPHLVGELIVVGFTAILFTIPRMLDQMKIVSPGVFS